MTPPTAAELVAVDVAADLLLVAALDYHRRARAEGDDDEAVAALLDAAVEYGDRAALARRLGVGTAEADAGPVLSAYEAKILGIVGQITGTQERDGYRPTWAVSLDESGAALLEALKMLARLGLVDSREPRKARLTPAGRAYLATTTEQKR